MPASILVIDPEEGFTTPLVEELKKQGFEASSVMDGKAGLARASSDKPAAIVLCVELGKMSGYTICARLKKDEVLRSIPLVITSADRRTQEDFPNHRTKKTRADAYLSKPFAASELVDVLGNLIDLNDSPLDTVSDLSLPEAVRLVHDDKGRTQRTDVSLSSPPRNGRAAITTDLGTSDLSPPPREDSEGELAWMAKLRQSIQRRDHQIADLRARLEDALRDQSAVAEKERRFQEEIVRIGKERDENVKAYMSMQEKLTSTRLDLDDAKKRAREQKKALEEKLSALEARLGESQDLQAKTATALEGAKRQVSTLSRELEETGRALEVATAEASKAEDRNRRQADQISNLEQRLEGAQADGQSKQSRIVELEKQLASLERQQEEDRAAAQRRAEEVRVAHENEIAAMEDRVAKLEADHAKEMIAIGEDLKAARVESESRSKTIAMRDDELAKQKSNYEKRLASADEELEKAQAAAEAKAKQHAKDLEAREASIQGLKQKIAALNEELTTTREEHQNMLDVSADVHAKETNRLREEHQEELARVQKQHAVTLKGIQQDKANVSAELESARSKAAEQAKRISSLEQEVGATQKALETAKREKEELEQELSTSRARAEEVDRLLEQGRKTKEQLIASLDEMGSLVETVRGVVVAMPPEPEAEG